MGSAARSIIKANWLQEKTQRTSGTLIRKKKVVYNDAEWVLLCIDNGNIPVLEWYHKKYCVSAQKPAKVVNLSHLSYVTPVLSDDRSFAIGFSHSAHDVIEFVALTSDDCKDWVRKLTSTLARLNYIETSNMYSPLPLNDTSISTASPVMQQMVNCCIDDDDDDVPGVIAPSLSMEQRLSAYEQLPSSRNFNSLNRRNHLKKSSHLAYKSEEAGKSCSVALPSVLPPPLPPLRPPPRTPPASAQSYFTSPPRTPPASAQSYFTSPPLPPRSSALTPDSFSHRCSEMLSVYDHPTNSGDAASYDTLDLTGDAVNRDGSKASMLLGGSDDKGFAERSILDRLVPCPEQAETEVYSNSEFRYWKPRSIHNSSDSTNHYSRIVNTVAKPFAKECSQEISVPASEFVSVNDVASTPFNVQNSDVIHLSVNRAMCINHIVFSEVSNKIWVAGFSQASVKQLTALFSIGDQIVEIGGVTVESIQHLSSLMQTSQSDIEVLIDIAMRKTPLGHNFAVRKGANNNLGIIFHGNTVLINDIHLDSPAWKAGMRPRIPSTMKIESETFAYVTQINGQSFYANSSEADVFTLLNSVSFNSDVIFTINPYDFIKELRKKSRKLN